MPASDDFSQPNETVRAFFGLSFCHESRRTLMKLRDSIYYASSERHLMRPVADESLHLTLKFLGNVKTATLPDYAALLASAAQMPKLEPQLVGVAGLQSAHRAKVIVAEIEELTGALARCAEVFDLGAERLGVARESRRFLAHVTLIRLKHPHDVSHSCQTIKVPRGPLVFDAIRLYLSTLSPNGSKYADIARFALGG